MTAPDLQTRLLAAIAEQERRARDQACSHPGRTLSMCAAHREIVDQYTVTKKKLDSVTRRLREHGPDARLQQFRAVYGTELVVLRRVLESLARGHGPNPEG